MQVIDVMTSKPSYCTQYWTVEAVAALMDHAGTGIVPVVEELLHRTLAGVVTDRDLCLRVVAPGKYPAQTWVKECMTSHPTCCHPEDSVETALQLMRDKRVRRLPVVDQQMQLQGMVSISDFIRCDGVDRTLLYDTVNGICQRSCKIEGDTASMSKAA